MGGLAVAHPHKDSTPRRTSESTLNSSRSEGRKHTGVRKNKSKAAMVTDPPAVAVAKSLVMGQVKILKRGETLNDIKVVTNEPPPPTNDSGRPRRDKKISDDLKIDDFALSSTNRLGPDPEMVNIAAGGFFFAGSGFVDSPPPTSLPLPTGFFNKKDDPNTDLRRILGLSLC